MGYLLVLVFFNVKPLDLMTYVELYLFYVILYSISHIYRLWTNIVIMYLLIYRTSAWWRECSAMAREIWVQSQVESYQSLKKWYLMPPCLTLSNIRYGSRLNWSNPEKGVANFPTPQCSSYWKGSLRVTLDYGHQLSLLFLSPYETPVTRLKKSVWSSG